MILFFCEINFLAYGLRVWYWLLEDWTQPGVGLQIFVLIPSRSEASEEMAIFVAVSMSSVERSESL